MALVHTIVQNMNLNRIAKLLQIFMNKVKNFAKSIWCNLLKHDIRVVFFATDLKEWIHMNLKQDLGHDLNINWSCVWATSCHFLWTWRNREMHEDSRLRPTHPWRYILDCNLKYITADANNIALPTRQQVEIGVAWQRPVEGWVVLNTDGASRRTGVAGCGGLLRNSNGQWLGGFSRHLGRCSAYIAELWGVFEGLRLARERGISKINVQVDSRVVVQTLNSSNLGSVLGWRLIQEIRHLLSLDWEILVCHSYREANACADALANMGCDHGPELRVYDQCPASLISLLQADVMGITTPRVISV
jgi:ribonuclease HI